MLDGRVWLSKDDKSFLGKGRVELLKLIGECGSITKAAKEMKMSYKAAWDSIESMNNLSPHTLVERVSGGSGGGGTILTEYAKKLILAYSEIETEHRRFLERISLKIDEPESFLNVLKRISMKVSARNQIAGKVSKIVEGAVNVELFIEIKGGDKITAIITKEAAMELELKVGSEVRALFKANAVLVAKGEKPKISARNILEGKIVAVEKGAINADVRVELNGGNTIVAQITNDACEELSLKAGESVYAVLKASAIMLGVE